MREPTPTGEGPSGTLGEHLARAADAHAQAPALVEAATGLELSHGQLARRLGQVAALLQRDGVRPGEVVTLVGGNSLDMVLMLLGSMAYGAVANPLNPALTAKEMETLLRHSGSRHVYAERAVALDAPSVEVHELSAYRPLPAASAGGDVRPESGALLIYTSGTTGKPKGVLLSHGNLVANVRTAIDWFHLDERHRTLCLLPLFHTFGPVSDVLPMLFSGGAAVIAPVFDVSRLRLVEQAIDQYQVQSFSAVPLMFDLCLRLGVRLGRSLRYGVSGAAPLHPKTIASFAETYGVPIIPAYGMTEMTCFCTISPPDAVVPGSAGVPARMQVRVVDEHGRDLPRGEIGELVTRGDNVMRGGYFRDDRTCYLDPEGTWFLTGDLGRVDERGYVFITGRKKNMVIRGGEKVYLEDLDRCLAQLAGVADTATVGVSAGSVEKMVCFVVREVGHALEEGAVMGHLRAELGDAKSPDRVVFCASIPRTPTNKVKIAELQAQAREHL